ncbi:MULTISPECIES: hypothetical protein [Niallia]|uniref:Uncharacterized protein n=1 Tax=Niallia taxi TaxID=2499688 RepID=A0A3S2UDY7_9BACI|nr:MULTISPECIES: hypothetical protein [Niallia]MDK8643714.1 hypothetical protein [Niallia taxi]MED4041305.1 hypothetical protein [Niallia taxi]MED4057658.1 hypothetical protein [Niallia taxi]MED4122233.1 hypothetical protein [Niallia taxi]RVT59468.1 hypothetical protein EM808_19430 [Niallia taxi]
MRLLDVLTDEEKQKVDELKLLLMDAFGDKQRAIIVSDINEILDSARARYYEMLKASEEQSATVEFTAKRKESLAFKISNLINRRRLSKLSKVASL